MGGRRKPSFEEVKNLFENRGYVLLENKYIDSKTKMRYICKIHNQLEQETTYSRIKSGHGCRYCANERIQESQRLDFNFVKSAFENRGYILLEENYINNSTPMKYLCPKHPDRDLAMSYSSIKKGDQCPYCAKTAKYTFDEVKKLFELAGYEMLDDDYKDNKTHIRYRCPEHPDKDLKMTLKSLNKGVKCPFCAKVGRSTIDDAKIDFEKMGYVLLEEQYVNTKTKMKCYCIHHKEIIQFKTHGDIKRNSGCPYCSKVAKHTIDEVRLQFEKRNYVLLSEEYLNVSAKLKYICKKHDYKIREIAYYSFLSGSGCNDCGIERTKNSYDNVKSLFKEKNYILLDNEYINGVTKMNYICTKHPEKIRQITFDKLNSGQGCVDCYLERNRGENNVNWNPNKTDEERLIDRNYYEYIEWKKQVFKRDKYSCQKCGTKRKKINAHHKDGYNWCKERRTDVENGVTLCVDCHNDFHSIYGFGDNTKEQYNEWIKTN